MKYAPVKMYFTKFQRTFFFFKFYSQRELKVKKCKFQMKTGKKDITWDEMNECFYGEFKGCHIIWTYFKVKT